MYRADRQLPEDDDGEEKSTVVVYASCAIGDMVDWLKANPAFSMHDYMWKLSVPFTRIMAADATQVVYLSDKQKEEYKGIVAKKDNKVYEDPMEFVKALGIPIMD